MPRLAFERTVLGLAVAAALDLGAVSGSRACQRPPDDPQIVCRLVPASPVVSATDPFQVYFTVINMPVTAPFPPPYLDDWRFQMFVSGPSPANPSPCNGFFARTHGEATFDPAAYELRLDEAWSPYADEPTSDTRVITATPVTPGEVFAVQAQACAVHVTGGGCERQCQTTLCIATDPQSLAAPYGQFLEPLRSGDAGSTLPFRLRVLRNGYDPARPLTVRVIPENFSDPVDLFPLTPADLPTAGWTVTGDDETLEFTCTTHYPCFVGVDNAYHVTISDGPTVLWDSRRDAPYGIGRALVGRSPLARQELVEIRDDGGDGAIAAGEHATIHLRLFARNPYFAAALATASLATAIPDGLTVVSYDLHFHDNPMDAYDPTPAELAAAGTVTVGPGSFRVETASIEARFGAPPFDPPPAVFRDLFEVELVVETPPGGLSPQDLVFPGVTVEGDAGGALKSETSGPIVIPVSPVRPPMPIAVLHAVKGAGGAPRLQWQDPAADAGHDRASRYRVFRSASPDSGYTEIGTVADTPAPVEETVDASAPASPGVYHYRVISGNSGGDSEPLPPG